MPDGNRNGARGPILAIDPGSDRSAWVVLSEKGVPIDFGIWKNETLESRISRRHPYFADCRSMAIELIRTRGMAMPQEAIDTAVWVGRFISAWRSWPPDDWHGVDRMKVKVTICGNARAKDANIRQALIDRFGGKRKAVGGVKCPKCKGKGWFGPGRPTCPECEGRGWEAYPGPLHGIAKDEWQALAVGLTVIDSEGKSDE